MSDLSVRKLVLGLDPVTDKNITLEVPDVQDGSLTIRRGTADTVGPTLLTIPPTGEVVISDFEYTGTLTGGTGIINIGSNQIVKDAAGNVGLGVVPSAWGSPITALEVGAVGNAIYEVTAAQLSLSNNSYFNGTNFIYGASLPATRVDLANGGMSIFTAPSGTAGNPITFTQAMTLTNGGNLLVGTTVDSGTRLNVTREIGDVDTDIQYISGGLGRTLRFGVSSSATTLPGSTRQAFFIRSSTVNAARNGLNFVVDGGNASGDPDSGHITFATGSSNAAVERARITSVGDFIKTVNTAAPALTVNNTMTTSLPNNTTLRFHVRGSDGVTRTADLTLA